MKTLMPRLLLFLALAATPATALATPCGTIDGDIECGDTISVPLPSLTQVMDDYYFDAGYYAGEYVYEFVVPPGLNDLTIIHPMVTSHALFLMGPSTCDSSACGWWDNTGVGNIKGGLVTGASYYLAIDAWLPIAWNSWVDVTLVCNGLPYELCGGGLDLDGDGLVDCDDPSCQEWQGCLQNEVCYNNADDNGNGLVDCADPLCFGYWGCQVEDCTDGLDNNNDSLIDCLDPYCFTHPACPETDCADGVDNDLDALIDCQDPDCPNHPCPPEDCSDGIDNDLDGHVDCLDVTDCHCDPACWGGEDCSNNFDDDKDGAVDCNDCECFLQKPCLGETGMCDDGADNDGDGFIDCDDAECETDPVCVGTEDHCYDYIDNDFDGLFDCQDPDCATHWYCTGECVIVDSLTCGTAANWETNGDLSTELFADYEECGVEDRYYPENAFALPWGENVVVDIVLYKGTVDSLNIVEAVGGGICVWDLPCVETTTPGTPITFSPDPGSDYYVLVEGSADIATYDLTVDCYNSGEDCETWGDQDLDGLGDCDDPDCANHEFPDEDGDGFDICSDCYDYDDTVYPGAPEIPCDTVDQDCDGADDQDLDADGDGYYSEDCDGGDDCDDGEPTTNPGADEICDDGVDNDCDGLIDDDDPDCAVGDDDDDDDDDDSDDDDGDDDSEEPPCQGCCCEDCSCSTLQGRTRAGLSMTLILAMLGLLTHRRRTSGRSLR